MSTLFFLPKIDGFSFINILVGLYLSREVKQCLQEGDMKKLLGKDYKVEKTIRFLKEIKIFEEV